MKLFINMTLAMLLTISVCVFAPAAGAAVIDFEPLAHDGDDVGDYFPTYTEDGFIIGSYDIEDNTLTEDLTVFGTAAEGAYAGSTMLMNDGWGTLTVMNAAAGSIFTVDSIDLSELSDYNTESYNITFSGLLSDGSTVTQAFTLDGTFGAETFSFGENFTDLVSLSWDSGAYGVQFDNINTSAVPIPATIWLMSFGIAGLAGIKRRFALK